MRSVGATERTNCNSELRSVDFPDARSATVPTPLGAVLRN